MSTMNTRAERLSPMAEPPPTNTPYWLLWLIGLVAFVLCTVAFALWVMIGPSTLFDMIVTLCT